MKIKVIRAFYIGGKLKEVDDELEVEKILGIELISANKAVEVLPAAKKNPEKSGD